MKRSILTWTLLLPLAASTALACKSTPADNVANTVSSASSLQADYEAFGAQLEVTVNALSAVYEGREGDLGAAYETYAKALEDLESRTKKVSKGSDALRKNFTKYVESWEEQMAEVQSAELQEQAAARRAELQTEFDEAQEELANIKSNLDQLFTDLNEVRVVLDADLTPAGVQSLEPFIERIQDRAEPAAEDVEKIVAALQEVQDAMSTPAPPPAE